MNLHGAPACTTCHGFEVDMRAATPMQLVKRCALCHTEERGLNPEFQTLAREALQEKTKEAPPIPMPAATDDSDFKDF